MCLCVCWGSRQVCTCIVCRDNKFKCEAVCPLLRQIERRQWRHARLHNSAYSNNTLRVVCTETAPISALNLIYEPPRRWSSRVNRRWPNKVLLLFLMWRLLICRLFHPRFCGDGSVPPGAPVTAGPLQQNTCVWQVNRFHLSSWIICGDHPSYVYTGVIDWGRGSVGQAGRVCRTCLFYSLVSTADVIVCEHTNLFHSTIFFRIWTKNSEQTKFSIGCTQPRFHKCWDAAWIIKKKKKEKKKENLQCDICI